MKLRCLRWLVFVVLAMAVAAPVRAQSFGFPWWRDGQFQRDLSLTTEQSNRIDEVFRATITKLREKKEQLDKDEAELSRLIAADADEQTVMRQVDRVETVRGRLNKMRTLMLFQMRQVLTPEQRVKLDKLHERWEKDHPRGRGDNRQGRGDNRQGRGKR